MAENNKNMWVGIAFAACAFAVLCIVVLGGANVPVGVAAVAFIAGCIFCWASDINPFEIFQ